MPYVGKLTVETNLDRVAKLGHVTAVRKFKPVYLGFSEFWMGYRYRILPADWVTFGNYGIADALWYGAGLCSGTTNAFNSRGVSLDNGVYARSGDSQLLDSATTGGGKRYLTGGGVGFYSAIGGVETGASGGAFSINHPADESVRGLHVLRFVPNYGTNVWRMHIVYPAGAALEADVTDVQFKDMLEAPDWTTAVATLPAGYTSRDCGTVAVAAAPVLDSVFFSWSLDFSRFMLSEIVCSVLL